MDKDTLIVIYLAFECLLLGIVGYLLTEIICDRIFKIKCVRCDKGVRMPKYAMCDCCHKEAHKLVERRVNCVLCKKFTRDKAAICNNCYAQTLPPTRSDHDPY